MEKIVQIDDNTRIVIDPLNYILQFRRKSKSEITWKTAAYYADLASLLIEYLNMAPRRSENAIQTLQEILVAIREADQNIKNFLTNKK